MTGTLIDELKTNSWVFIVYRPFLSLHWLLKTSMQNFHWKSDDWTLNKTPSSVEHFIFYIYQNFLWKSAVLVPFTQICFSSSHLYQAFLCFHDWLKVLMQLEMFWSSLLFSFSLGYSVILLYKDTFLWVSKSSLKSFTGNLHSSVQQNVLYRSANLTPRRRSSVQDFIFLNQGESKSELFDFLIC